MRLIHFATITSMFSATIFIDVIVGHGTSVVISRECARDYEDDLEKADRRDVGEGNEEKKKAARSLSPPMNHSRRYRPIWTSSPACSEHVYLRFRVSTSRHCTRRFSLSLFLLPFLGFIGGASISRKCDVAVPGTLNGTLESLASRETDPPLWNPRAGRETEKQRERNDRRRDEEEEERKVHSFVSRGAEVGIQRFSVGRRFFESRLLPREAGESPT